MFARTKNLLLRPGWPEDAPALARALRGNARSANAAADALVDAQAFLSELRDARLPSFLITLRTDSAPLVIGTIGLVQRGLGRIELSCWIEEDQRGRGFEAEARNAVLGIAQTLGLTGIATAYAAEEASLAA